MKIPDALAPLVDDGIIERVVRPLMSGKEAQVFLVVAQGQLRVAKVYKDSQQRSFKNRAEYTEGRKTRNSRDQRAVAKRTKHGRAQDEAAWKSTEIDMIYRLHAGGVRVPVPYAYFEGVLVMECVVDPDGDPAPRLGDVSFEPEAARVIYERVLREVVRMLAVGVVHGDLSDFNVLAAGDVPVIIDFPQSVDAASNTNARKLLIRDVDNMHRFLTRHVPRAPRLPYGEELWALHENAALTADTQLTGRYRPPQRRTSNESVLDLIQDADRDERRRRDQLGLRGGPRPVPGLHPQHPQHGQHGQYGGQQGQHGQGQHAQHGQRGQQHGQHGQPAPQPRGAQPWRGEQRPRGPQQNPPGRGAAPDARGRQQPSQQQQQQQRPPPQQHQQQQQQPRSPQPPHRPQPPGGRAHEQRPASPRPEGNPWRGGPAGRR
ncbi:MAG: hypothetical protein NVSMB47_06340 [Polyangiales bacterium]